jgi:hypothetical protein
MNRATDQVDVSSASSSVPVRTILPDDETSSIDESIRMSEDQSRSGRLIVNADDWGRDPLTTRRILDCALRRTVSSVSAMVFMEDSERAAAVARKWGIDAGLHLNFTTPFSAPRSPARLIEHQRELARYLLGHRFARAVFHPALVRSFQYVMLAQLDEFRRLYEKTPDRLDGHHHAHLCANVLLQGLLPEGLLVRRNFSFQPGEKSWGNRLYRRIVDRMLSRQHRLVDFLFSLTPLEPERRLRRIFLLARQYAVEVETHPVNQQEYEFLAGGRIFRWTRELPIASRFEAPLSACPTAPISRKFDGIGQGSLGRHVR